MVNVHCSICDGTGRTSDRRTCLSCEGTGITKMTDSAYEGMLENQRKCAKIELDEKRKRDAEYDRSEKRFKIVLFLIVAVIVGGYLMWDYYKHVINVQH